MEEKSNVLRSAVANLYVSCSSKDGLGCCRYLLLTRRVVESPDVDTLKQLQAARDICRPSPVVVCAFQEEDLSVSMLSIALTRSSGLPTCPPIPFPSRARRREFGRYIAIKDFPCGGQTSPRGSIMICI